MNDPGRDAIADALRYERHLVLPEIGPTGQERLRAGRVLVVGIGGLGSPVAMYLAAAGVGTIGLVDDDVVELSNLQRQIVHGESTLGELKVDSASRRIGDINPGVDIETFPIRVGELNAATLVAGFDLVLGCVDDIPARYHLNQACVDAGVLDIFGAVAGFEGQVAVFPPKGKPCYRCFFREPPPAGRKPIPAEKGVAAALPGVIGSLMAMEAMKVLLKAGDPLLGRLLLFDALTARFREKTLAPDPECPVCGG